ncbi:MAG: NAD(P)-binding domain-containing protein [bacterium]|nr:NAD(P)-binding domain-containing protein [bacterium]
MNIPTDFIEKSFSAADFLANCDEAFRLYGQGLAIMPPREQNLDSSGRFTLKMPASIPGYSGYKFIEELPSDSQGKLGQRTAIIKLQSNNGQEIEIDAEYITNMRTGAAGALGLKYFAPQVKSVALLGTGKISKALALCAVELGVSKINIYSRKPENREKFAAELSSLPVEIISCDSVESAISEVEGILTAVPTPEPILFFKDLPAGVFISAMGGDSRTTQLDKEIMTNAVVIPDNEEQCKKSGEFKEALAEGYYQDINLAKVEDRTVNIGDASLGRIKLDSRIKVAYFTGLAVQDINAAKMVYEKYNKKS